MPRCFTYWSLVRNKKQRNSQKSHHFPFAGSSSSFPTSNPGQSFMNVACAHLGLSMQSHAVQRHAESALQCDIFLSDVRNRTFQKVICILPPMHGSNNTLWTTVSSNSWCAFRAPLACMAVGCQCSDSWTAFKCLADKMAGVRST